LTFWRAAGTLSRSAVGIAKAIVFGGNIEELKIESFTDFNLDNFSQVYSMSIEKSQKFEEFIQAHLAASSSCDLSVLKLGVKFFRLREWLLAKKFISEPNGILVKKMSHLLTP